MTRFVGTPLRGIEFSSPSDEAVSARVVSDSNPRIRIDAGGRLTWSSGAAAGDVTLYRDAANVLKSDDLFQATGGVATITTNGAPTAASPDGTIAVDVTNDVFYFRSGGEWLQVSSGANVVISSTEPVGAESGDLWFDSDTLVLYILNGASWVSVSGSLTLAELDDVTITSVETGHVLKYNGTEWVNDLADTAYTAHTEVIGDGVTKDIVITHNFNTRDIVVQCRNVVAPYESIEVGWEATGLNTVTLRFAAAPASNSIRANVYAGIGSHGTNAYSETVGDGTATSFVLTHNFNTRDVVVAARNTSSPYETIEINWQATTVNSVTALFSVPPASSGVRITVYAGGGVAGVTSIIGTANEIEVSQSTGTVQVGLPADVALSGVPTAPTAVYGTDTTQIATTAFVQDAVGGFATNLDGLSDVVITAPEEFQGLSYNGTNWVNSHIPLVSYVRNAESTTLTTGTAVYLFGSTGDHATVKRADNNSDSTSSKTIGLVGANIPASENGPVITRGYVDGIDLSVGYTAGDVLWLGENGAFTTTKPTAPDHLVFIGVVVRATNNGIVYVATQNGYELDELHDVSIVGKTSGDFLKYNGSIWVNDQINLGTDTVGNYVSDVTQGNGILVTHTAGEGSSASIALNADLNDLNDVSVVDPIEGELLIRAAGGWQNVTASGDVTVNSSGVFSIAANSVALGADTTGNYVSDITAGTGVTVTHTPSEGSSPTIAIGQAVGTGDSPSFAGLTIGGDTAATQTYVNTAIANLVDSAPTTLDTLNELAAALGDDANFATTITNALAAKAPLASPALTGTPTAPTATADTNTTQIATTAFVQQELSAQTLDDLSGVNLTGAASGEFLKFDGTNWVSDSIPTINALDDIGDVVLTSPSSGQVLKYDGTNWINGTDNAGTTINSLDDVGDVTITSSQVGEVLRWNGTAWVNNLETGYNNSYAQIIGDGSTTTFVLTHNFGTRDIFVQCRNNASPYENISVRWEATTEDTVTLDFSVAPTSNSVRVNVYASVGVVGPSAFSQTIGDGTNLSYAITHNLQTRDIVVSARNAASPYEVVDINWEATDNNTVTALFQTPPSSNSIRVSVYAAGGVAGVTSIQGTANEVEVSSSTGGVTVGLPTDVTVAGELTTTTLMIGSIEVSVAGATSGQFLGFDGTDFVPTSIPTINALDDVGDVTITSGSAYDVLQYDGFVWTNSHTLTINSTVNIFGTDYPMPTSVDDNGLTISSWGALPFGRLGTGVSTPLIDTPSSQLLISGEYIYFHPNFARNSVAPTGLNAPGVASAFHYLTDSWTPSGTIQTYVARSGGINTTHVGAMSLGLTYRQSVTQMMTNSDFYIAFTDDVDAIDGNVTMFVPADLTIENPLGPVHITGDLTVSGTTTTLNTTELLIEDNLITLNSGVTGSPTLDAGIEVERGTSDNVSILWNESVQKWQFTNDGATYKDLGSGGVTVSDDAPSSPAEGDMWYESDTGSLFAYYDASWVEIGPGAVYDQIIGSIQAKGDLLVGDASQSIARLGVGSNGARLAANSSTSTGLAWVSDSQNSVVDAKGDLLVGASADTLARLPVGSNGQMLVADSSQTYGVGWSSVNTRNLLYNGSMQVAQRGTSATIGTSASGTYHTVDRWSVFTSNAGNWAMYQGGGGNSLNGFPNHLSMYVNDTTPKTSAGYCHVSQKLEGQDLQIIKKGTASAEALTISFWVKVSGYPSMLGTYIVEIQDTDNNRHCSRAYTINTLGAWEYKTVTFPADVVGQLTNDNNESLRVNFWLYAGTNYTSGSLSTSWASQVNANRAVGQTDANAGGMASWNLTGVQLNVGSVAAPFEFKSYERELRECQRYYWRNTAPTGVSNGYLTGFGNVAYNTNSVDVVLNNPVSMRAPATGTVDYSNIGLGDDINATVTGVTPRAINAAYSTTNTTLVTFDKTSGFTTRYYYAIIAQAAGGYIGVSAEL